MARLKKDTRTKDHLQTIFLEKFEEWANITQACRITKVSRRTIYNWRDTDMNFRVKFENSRKIAVDVLEDEMVRRALHGVQEPVYQGGKKVGTVQKYSDTLAIFLMKAHKPETYREPIRHEIGGLDGEPIKTETTVISEVDFSKLTTQALDEILAARIKSEGD